MNNKHRLIILASMIGWCLYGMYASLPSECALAVVAVSFFVFLKPRREG